MRTLKVLGLLTLLTLAVGAAHADSIIVELSGSGGKNTRPFTSPGAWEIQWDARGAIFQLYVYSVSGDLVGVAANQQGSGKGTSYQPKSGTYYLQVNAIGPWNLTVKRVSSVSGPSTPNPGGVIVKLSGSGAKNTRPFAAPGPWEIQWDARGDIFQIYVYGKSGNLIGVAANQMGSGKGNSYQPRGGEYYLQVNAIGAWALEVVDMR
jgi:hypothetical protein